MLRQEERIGLILKADREKLRAIDRILTGNDVQQPARPVRPGPEDFRLFTLTEAARRLAVSRPTVYRWISNGTLRVTRVGRRYRVSVTEMRGLQESRPQCGPDSSCGRTEGKASI